MSVPPPTLQRLRVDGELQIDTSAGYKESNGLISFVGPFNQKLGQIRAYGFGAFNSLLMDASNCLAGFEVRTNVNQGSSLVSGKDDQFPLTISSDITKIKSLTVTQDQTQFRNQFDGQPLFRVNRGNTTIASSLDNSIVDITQNQWKSGETMRLNFGASTYSGCASLSYTLPTSSSASAADNYSAMSMTRNGVTVENFRMLTTGDVTFPFKIQAATIEGTNWIGLPATPPPNLNPITLDDANDRVGINTTTPSYDLDVNGTTHTTNLEVANQINAASVAATGNIQATGIVQADTISATNYIGLPSPNVSPITLDDTNGFVGINKAVPAAALDVVGDITTSTKIITPLINGLALRGQNGSVNVGGSAGTLGPYAGVAIGQLSGATLQGDSAVAIGDTAGNSSQGLYSIAIGRYSGEISQGQDSIAIGRRAGGGTQGTQSVAIGPESGRTNQGVGSVALGFQAGNANQGTKSVSIGYQAGITDQHANSIVVNATGAGLNTTASSQLIVKPIRNQAGPQSLAYDPASGEISYSAAPTPDLLPITLDKTNNRVGINKTVPTATLDVTGTIAASTSITTPLVNQLALRSNKDSVHVGGQAGSMTSFFAVAVGNAAGKTAQEDEAVAVGNEAGGNGQKAYAIAIGSYTGSQNQGSKAIAIGVSAAQNNQGENSIAIGMNAARNNQHTSSIVLNATGADLNTTAASQFVVKPVRENESNPKALGYDPTTGEITYMTKQPAGPTTTTTYSTFFAPAPNVLAQILQPTPVTLSAPGTYIISVHFYIIQPFTFAAGSLTHSFDPVTITPSDYPTASGYTVGVLTSGLSVISPGSYDKYKTSSITTSAIHVTESCTVAISAKLLNQPAGANIPLGGLLYGKYVVLQYLGA